MKDIILVLLIAVVIDSLVVFLSYYWRNLQRAKQVKRNRQLLLNISESDVKDYLTQENGDLDLNVETPMDEVMTLSIVTGREFIKRRGSWRATIGLFYSISMLKEDIDDEFNKSFNSYEEQCFQLMVSLHIYTKKYLLIAEEIAEKGEIFYSTVKGTA